MVYFNSEYLISLSFILLTVPRMLFSRSRSFSFRASRWTSTSAFKPSNDCYVPYKEELKSWIWLLMTPSVPNRSLSILTSNCTSLIFWLISVILDRFWLAIFKAFLNCTINGAICLSTICLTAVSVSNSFFVSPAHPWSKSPKPFDGFMTLSSTAKVRTALIWSSMLMELGWRGPLRIFAKASFWAWFLTSSFKCFLSNACCSEFAF